MLNRPEMPSRLSPSWKTEGQWIILEGGECLSESNMFKHKGHEGYTREHKVIKIIYL
jgi:hypothetical protein